MNGFLLDTNVPSETLRPLPDAKVTAWLKAQARGDQFLSVVTIGELRRGITLLAAGPKRTKLEHFVELTASVWFAGRILPVTQAVAERRV